MVKIVAQSGNYHCSFFKASQERRELFVRANSPVASLSKRKSMCEVVVRVLEIARGYLFQEHLHSSLGDLEQLQTP